MDWLERYALVEEQRFAEPKHSVAVARFFLDELARNGTTTAAVYGTVHAGAAEAFFAEAHHRNARMIAGKVLMDRNAPAPLMDTAAAADRTPRRRAREADRKSTRLNSSH